MNRTGHQVEMIVRRLTRRSGDSLPELPCVVHAYPQTRFPGVLRRVPQVDESVYDQRLLGFARLVAGKFRPTLVYERFSLYSLAGMRLARELGIPGVLEVNAPLLQERKEHEDLSAGVYSRTRERRILRAATRIIAVSRALSSYVERRGVPSNRIRVISNGVDVQRFHPRPHAPLPPHVGWPEGAFVLGFCGTLKPWHDLGLVLQALSEVPGLEQVCLMVIGDGPLRQTWEKEAAERGLDRRVWWVGLASEDRVPDLLSACDALCVPCPPSEDHYFSPLKLMEGLAMGLPVVATDIGDTASVANGDALLVPAGDAVALGNAIRKLVDDPRLRRALGVAGVQRARQHTWEAVVEESLEGL